MEMIKAEQLEGLKTAIEDARNDDTPYIGIKDDELHILGDPNKTEIQAADYVVRFAFPNTPEWRARAEANGDKITGTSKDKQFLMVERNFKNVYLSPRRMGAVVSTLAQIESFLYQVTENGELKELSRAEMMDLARVMNGELSDATYDVVATVLRIPYDEMEWMLPLNTMENVVKIAKNNPSAINEADLFFELPHENQ
ncbi:MAG: hypothetical protein U0L88_00395 [Acutalibacteraceae bacterium]|nr:hypothetical protein [Acutalibacteraceae bacterium]